MSLALRQEPPRHALSGFGRSRWADCHVVAIEHVEQLAQLFARCRAERTPLVLRGAGCSYGDPAMLAGGVVADLTALSRVLHWDKASGIIEVEPGVTIEGLWRHTLPDGYWPAVVPGTMRPTLGGCLAMNIHGKNNFRVGSIGSHVLDFDLLSVDGGMLRCSPSENADVFHAAISGLGLLGAIVRIRMQQKRVESGLLRVQASAASAIEGMFERFEQHLPDADYLVGWVDCLARGGALGRGLIHAANYLARDEDPLGPSSLQIEQQVLPASILGMPKSLLPWLMRPFMNDFAVRMVNAAKYHLGRIAKHEPFFQSLVAFSFLLDFVPGWELSYGRSGLIQFQVFAPSAEAPQLFREVISTSQAHGLPAYLGVMKRHRPDPFLLTHALDGYSLALDYRVTEANRERLQALLRLLIDRVLARGGKFYFAKDSVLSADDTRRAYGADVLAQFFALKARLDPEAILESELSKRVFGEQLRALA
jgi:decaprenylphospho-beta-D-ribofuranose 2-oxidase